MKKLIAISTAAMLLAAECCGCSKNEIIVFPEDELLSRYTSEADKAMTVIDETDRIKAVNFYRGEEEIYTEIYVPEGDGTFPVVVIADTSTDREYKDMAQTLSDSGITAVICECDCEDTLECSADIESVVEGLSKLSYIDTENIFLWGYDIGGVSTAYVGLKNPELIKGTILAEPDLLGGFDVYDYMPECNSKVLILAGNSKPSIGRDTPEAYERAQELLPSCEIIKVPGATHDFDNSTFDNVVRYTVLFVQENLTLKYYW